MYQVSLFNRALLLLVLLFPMLAEAALEIEITQGIEGAQPIAVGNFVGNAPDQAALVADVIRADLQRSGLFKLLDRQRFPQQPTTAEQVDYASWREIDIEALLIGSVIQVGQENYRVEFQLFDTVRKKRALGHAIAVPRESLRRAAHTISDIVFEYLTGVPGAFSTRIAFVSVEKTAGDDQPLYRLQVADADGHGAQTVYESRKQLMSPSWSPDGKKLAYVSFENDQTEVYVQTIASGERQRVSARPGINSAPAWSPDGQRLALTLSVSGDPEIYVMDLTSTRQRRLTRHRAIDTEPVWSPDGENIYFTSDRSGSPQIYVMSASGGKARRVTFEGNYNAAASVSPDGQMLALVNNSGQGYRIGLYHLKRRTYIQLTNGRLDESPSFAPNGSMILYATQEGKRAALAAVSVDGRVKQSLRLQEGEIRSPAWSNFH